MANSPIPPIPHPTTIENDVAVDLPKQDRGGGGNAANRRDASFTANGVTTSPSKPTSLPNPGHRVNVGEDDEMEIIGYVPSKLRMLLAILALVFSAGLVALVFYWKKVWAQLLAKLLDQWSHLDASL